VVNDDNGIVDHHSHSKHQPGQGYDIDGDTEQMEAQQTNNKRGRYGNTDQNRGLEVLHEEKHDQKSKGCAPYQTFLQVSNRIVQQFGLIARDLKVDGWIV